MGSIWLHDLDEWCREDGIEFREYPGWMTLSRSTGGFDQTWGIVAHHTGSATSWQNDCAYMWRNASTLPIGNVHLDRPGIFTLGAAGATNTQGRGIVDWHTSQGTIPIDPTTMGNRMAFAIEAANDGVGEEWPREQIDAYLRFMAMLCRRLRLAPWPDVTTHRGWAGTRKSDPFGPAEGYPSLGTTTWPVPALRNLVAARLTPAPPPDPPTTHKEMLMFTDLPYAAKLDSNGSFWLGDGKRRVHCDGKKRSELAIATGKIDIHSEQIVHNWAEVSTISQWALDAYAGAWDGTTRIAG